MIIKFTYWAWNQVFLTQKTLAHVYSFSQNLMNCWELVCYTDLLKANPFIFFTEDDHHESYEHYVFMYIHIISGNYHYIIFIDIIFIDHQVEKAVVTTLNKAINNYLYYSS